MHSYVEERNNGGGETGEGDETGEGGETGGGSIVNNEKNIHTKFVVGSTDNILKHYEYSTNQNSAFLVKCT